MTKLELLDYINGILDYQFMGITLKDPIIFCVKAIVIYLFIKILLWIVNYLYKRSVQRSKTHKGIDETSAHFLMRIVKTVVYILGIASVLSLIPALEKIGTSILASAGIMAMAVGLASQEALANFVGGIFIIIAKPFRIGDYIELDSSNVGTVVEITLRHTVIKSAENRRIIIPNSKINSSIIKNSTIADSATCAFIEVGVSYNEDLNKCISIMQEEVEKHALLIDHRTEDEKTNNVPKVIVRVMSLGDSSITLRANAWASSSSNAFILKHDMLKAIKERFDTEGIEIPYPYYNQIITAHPNA